MSIKKTHIEVSNFCTIMKQPKPFLKTIIKVFRKFHSKIKEFYLKKWELTPMGMEPIDEGVPKIEIDESEVFGNS